MGGVRLSSFVKRCVLAHMKRMALLVFAVVIPSSLLISLIGMIAAELPVREMLAVVLCGCGAGLLVFASMLFQTIRFVRMIRRQEEIFGVNFSQEQFAPTAPKARKLNQQFFSSASWYMCEGCWAFHRRYITKITQQNKHIRRGGRQYIAHVKTIDDKAWKLYMKSASDQNNFYTWWKSGRK